MNKNDGKKTSERKQLDNFLKIMQYNASDVKPTEENGLDFIIDSKIGIQITEYHSGAKEKNGCQRRQVEQAGLKLHNELIKSVKKIHALKEIWGVLEFKQLRLPPGGEYVKFIDEIMKVSLDNLPMQKGEKKVIIPSDKYPLMKKYLKQLKLTKEMSPAQWDWPGLNCVWLGPIEDEFKSIIKEKIEKWTKTDFKETWLLIVSGEFMSQTLPPDKSDLLSRLNSYQRCNQMLKNSGFSRAYVFNMDFNVVFEYNASSNKWTIVNRTETQTS